VSLLFGHAVARPDDEIDLAAAALLIAERDYEGLDVARYLGRLDELAEASRRRGPGIAGVRATLFDDLGFRGNSKEYGDARNSFLNDVLDRRTGIPITLSVVMMEVGWRLGLAMEGIGYPGHFLIRAEGRILDPFNGAVEVDPATLNGEGVVKAGKRAILSRMLLNLANLRPRRPWIDELQEALRRPVRAERAQRS
jgi:regulator of sirC expression with transglutaminase-like and TPR domain